MDVVNVHHRIPERSLPVPAECVVTPVHQQTVGWGGDRGVASPIMNESFRMLMLTEEEWRRGLASKAN